MRDAQSASGNFYRDVEFPVQVEDGGGRAGVPLDRSSRQQQPTGKLVAEPLLCPPRRSGASRTPSIRSLVEEAVTELVGDQEAPTLSIQTFPQTPIDVVPPATWSGIHGNAECISVHGDQKSLRTTLLGIETATPDPHAMASEPGLQVE